MRDNGRADTGSEVGSASVRDDDGGSGTPALSPKQLAVIAAVTVFVLDMLTKAWAQRALADGPIVIIEDFFQFRLTYNTGAAFSMFSGGGPVLALIALGVIGMIVLVTIM